MALATILIPLVFGLLGQVLSFIEAIRDHADTPEAVKAKLDAISADLQIIAAKVAAVELPDKQ